jgi:acetolactate synthase-1/2/3 large subunit
MQGKQDGPFKSAFEALTDLSAPLVSWTDLARGFGVRAVAVSTSEDLARELKQALLRAGPSLIEARL